MKNLTKSITLILVLISLNSFAQNVNPKFSQAIKTGLDMVAAAKGGEDYLKAENYFERIAAVETKEWIPSYYSAYCNLYAGYNTASKELKDQYWDKALQEIDKANALSANNSEIYALKGALEFMKMSVDPRSRMYFMGNSAESLEKAIALNPENPRIYLIKGQDTFYTPEAFGGGKEKAKPILESAVAKFAIFKPVNTIEPNWGAESAKALLAQCK
ncbi:hypothetical protein HDF26_001261 [Pedobacter cryoconitis]|uniref:Tetratricopeptide repeat protein n=1 Tax=Pedobacter cryoconitis TaxID=188932 RepID=A0A7W9E275_9SPHI|nr:hypothetical protein [Pedobacter cryoconitis]MBB5639024.1 hypothetical protein [Pedobacter cryoconitis]MBB6270834.1 hypothetical protein [Pedobacter cryoconitis]